jgi:CheY-like chemotaxis protein
MALRILLADESATIKKVIELSLQDYAVDLRIVNLGIDVLEVAKSFNPDIIFVDILLQKKNGYEVCHELKSAEETKDIPVIMLWSGFMEIDHAKLQVVGADDTLEKPFDSDAIRDLITKFVPQANTSNPLLEHVKVPDIPAPGDFTQVRSLDDINERLSANEESRKQEDDTDQAGNEPSWNMDSFDGLPELEASEPPSLEDLEEDDDFSHFEIKTQAGDSEAKPDTLIEFPDDDSDDDGAWVNQSLGKFKLDLPEEDEPIEELANLEIGEVDEISFKPDEFLWDAENTNAATQEDSKPELQIESKAPESPAVEESAVEPSPEPEITDTETSSFIAPPPMPSPIGSHPTEEELSLAPEIDLSDDSTDSEFEIEHNHELGIEKIGEPELKETPRVSVSDTHDQKVISDFLNSPAFESMLQRMLEEKVEAIIERKIPELAKSSIEKEIQRLLDEPYQE